MLAEGLHPEPIPSLTETPSMVRRGVSGSSPEEGSAEAPEIGAFCFAGACTISSVRWVWSPQVERAPLKRPKLAGSPRLFRCPYCGRASESHAPGTELWSSGPPGC